MSGAPDGPVLDLGATRAALALRLRLERREAEREALAAAAQRVTWLEARQRVRRRAQERRDLQARKDADILSALRAGRTVRDIVREFRTSPNRVCRIRCEVGQSER